MVAILEYVATEGQTVFTTPTYVLGVNGVAVTYSLYFVPDGGSAGASNLAIDQRTIGGGASEVIDIAVNHRIPPGAKIQALCSSANGVNIGGWGYDQTGEPA